MIRSHDNGSGLRVIVTLGGAEHALTIEQATALRDGIGTELAAFAARLALGPHVAALVPCPCGGGCNCDWCGGAGRLTKRALEAIQRDEDPE